jgi:hypothetical protein
VDPDSEWARRHEPPSDPIAEISALLEHLLDAAADNASDDSDRQDYLRARRRFANHLIWTLSFGAALEFQVEPWRLLWNGQPVYQPTTTAETLIQRLWADGVRWMHIKPGIDHAGAEAFVDHLSRYAFFLSAPDAHLVRSAPMEAMPGVGLEVFTERRFGQVPLGASPVEQSTHSLIEHLLELPPAPDLPQHRPELLHDGKLDGLPDGLEQGATIDLWSTLLDDFMSGPDPVPGIVDLGRAVRQVLADPALETDPARWVGSVDTMIEHLIVSGQPEALVRLLTELRRADATPEYDGPAHQAVDTLLVRLVEPVRLHALLLACSGIDEDSPVIQLLLAQLPPMALARVVEVAGATEHRAWQRLRGQALPLLRDSVTGPELQRYSTVEKVQICRILGGAGGALLAPFFAERIPRDWASNLAACAPWIFGLGAAGDVRAAPLLSGISGRGPTELVPIARQDLFRLQEIHDRGHTS